METDHIKIIETVLTDSNEHVLDNQMTTEEMLPILEVMDRVGFYAIECFSGRIFDSAFQTLEDPWERLAAIRRIVKNTRLLLTMQGARIFSDRLYPDAMVEAFIDVCAENGISIFRFYDRDNDLTHLHTAVSAAQKNGAEVQIALVYDTEVKWKALVEKAEKVEAMGADVIFIRDTKGAMTPYTAASVFQKLRERVSVPLGLQMCQITGFAEMSYLKAAENGCRIFDTAISPFFAAVSHPATEVMAEVFRDSELAAGLDSPALQKVDDYFRTLSEEYQKRRIFGPEKRELNFTPQSEMIAADSEDFLYDDLTEEDIKRIRTEIALVEKSPLDAVTFALYPEETKAYLARR